MSDSHGPAFGAVLALATMSGFFTLFAVSVLAPFIIPDLGLSRAAFGSITSVLYLTAAALSVIAGWLVERITGRAALVLLFATAAAGWGMIASARSFTGLLVGAAVAGLPMAIALPATTRLIRAEVAPGRRGTFLGVAQAGSQVGGLLAGASLPSLAVQIGWRLALANASSLALVGAVLASRSRLGTMLPIRATMRPPVNRRMVGSLALYGFVMNAGATVTTAYLPIFAYESLRFSARIAGAVAVVVALIAIAAKVLWGRVTEAARNPLAAPIALAATSVAAGVFLAVSTEQRAWLLWPAVLLFAAGAVSWSVTAMTVISRLSSLRETGRSAGLVMLSSFLGAAVAPVGFGWLVDLQGHYHVAWSATVGLYAVGSIGIGFLAASRMPTEPTEPDSGPS